VKVIFRALGEMCRRGLYHSFMVLCRVYFVRWLTVYLAITAASMLVVPIHIPEDHTV